MGNNYYSEEYKKTILEEEKRIFAEGFEEFDTVWRNHIISLYILGCSVLVPDNFNISMIPMAVSLLDMAIYRKNVYKKINRLEDIEDGYYTKPLKLKKIKKY